ncbi:hypothetical protein PtA15_2A939 [Puccinia triticina]|uniref:C2H2-type domain-containing protein n=1 Tax=Puccinia triticina TaxID=208348 RepID=A0ABY7CFB0_9BASI|nr:uncharacterized protein PtA15_2A939 [Puccinia triticina]WAQ82622.1 hypothetical protein PtA15_2A939 [Puccinia triticina]
MVWDYGGNFLDNIHYKHHQKYANNGHTPKTGIPRGPLRHLDSWIQVRILHHPSLGRQCSDTFKSDRSYRKLTQGPKRGVRVPESLLKVLENPIVYPGDGDETDHEDLESAEPRDTEGSTSENPSKHQIRARTNAFPICLVCPGKVLKTETLLEEHLRGQAHTRRLARYEDFIHNPPPHTSLSPDATDVIELLDALIGPPPVVPAGSTQLKKKQKRRKRRSAKHTQSEKTSKTAGEGNPSSESKKSPRKRNKAKTRERVRKGKRERQEKLAKSNEAETP